MGSEISTFVVFFVPFDFICVYNVHQAIDELTFIKQMTQTWCL